VAKSALSIAAVTALPEDRRKARGAFFTPPEVARFIVEWAVRDARDRTFEPACGEAIFMLAATERLRSLGARGPLNRQLHGAELHPPSAVAAFDALHAEGVRASIAIGDFFDFAFDHDYDAVVGNPPYVRYQDFTGASRTRARERALAAGVRLTGLASSWAAFAVQSAQMVAPNGRLGLVLPAELLSVNYAAPVRRFLMQRFAHVQLIMFQERVFPGVLEEVVLLLAEGEGPTPHIEICQAQNLDDLGNLRAVRWTPGEPGEKWTPALVDGESFDHYARFMQEGHFAALETWGSTGLGMVTGNNAYFTLTVERAREVRLPESDLLPISPPGSRHLRGVTFTKAAWSELAQVGRRVYLFFPEEHKPSAAAKRYVALGEESGVEGAYKCRVRSPWWKVPTVGPPDLFFTYMNHDTPRLVANAARVSYLNSIHGITLRRELRKLGKTLLPVGALNSVTLLGAEIVGRAYGGGLLKVEPKEADLLPVPMPGLLEAIEPEILAISPHVARALRAGDLPAAVKMVDDTVLVRHLGVKRSVVRDLREARDALFARRVARSVKQR
jgi:adenine-specific DNA methylase